MIGEGERFTFWTSLIVVKVTPPEWCHDHLVVLFRCFNAPFFTSPAHYYCIFSQTTFQDFVPADQTLAVRVHERFQAVERVLEDAASRRLGLPSSAPQVRAVLALSSAVQKAAIRMWAASCDADDGANGPADDRQAGIPDGPGTGSGRTGGRHEPATVSVGEQSDPILSLADAVRAVTAAIGEIIAGLVYGSMALLADGFHMATHAGALAVAAAARSAAPEGVTPRSPTPGRPKSW